VVGWQSFELRQYDSKVGRWLSVDPKRQYWSSYLGMGNDPVNGVDPDGGWRSKARAERMHQRAIDQGLDPGDLYQVGDHWGFNTVDGNSVTFNHKLFGATNPLCRKLVGGDAAGLLSALPACHLQMVLLDLFTDQSGDLWGKQCEKNRPWAFRTTFRTTGVRDNIL